MGDRRAFRDRRYSHLIWISSGPTAHHLPGSAHRALDALIDGDTLVITTLDRLGRSTQNRLAFADEFRGRGAGLRVLNLGGGDVDTATPMGSMLFTIMAALASPTVRFEALSAWSKAVNPLRRLPAISECLEQRFIDGRVHSRTSRVASSLKATLSDHRTPPKSDQIHNPPGAL